MKKYDSYKDSGIEWIGDIPEHWHIKRLKYIGSLYSGLSGKSGSDFEKTPTDNFKPFINFTNIANNKYIVGDNFGFVKIDENENQNQVKKNDLFFLMSSENQEDVGKSALLLNDYEELYLNSFCKGFRLTINSDARFVNYLLTSSALSQLISLEGRGFTRINLRMEGVENLPIILPQSNEEQTTIANYLDHKTNQIDQLITKKEQFIQLLEEERVAVINHAVTKGLDPTVTMKDSGIEWLGEIPEHWEVKRIKHLLSEPLKYGANESAEEENLDDPRYIRITDFGNDGKLKANTFKSLPYSKAENFLLSEGDILFARSGATVGKTFFFNNYKGIACFAGYLIKASCDRQLLIPEFLYEFTNTGSYNNWKQSIFQQSTIQNIGADKYNQLKIAIPPISEQKSIVEFLKNKSNEIALIITKTEQEVELLKEYKTALISEVVTGKVDVRNEKVN